MGPSVCARVCARACLRACLHCIWAPEAPRCMLTTSGCGIKQRAGVVTFVAATVQLLQNFRGRRRPFVTSNVLFQIHPFLT